MSYSNKKTYLFYDIETTGLNKCFDQIIQFAAIRTDIDFNELERHEYFVRLNCDVIPSPKAFITHRISLSKLKNGIDEFTAIKKIHQLLNTPGTISIGYNTLGFDDEFLRFSFYRNLLSPYTHQYSNDCTRMDLYPMTVMYFLFKNDLLKWPENNLKLENINLLNGFVKGAAHNAMVDVSATLSLAKCLRQDTKTWEYLCGFFDKQTDLARCHQVAQNSNYPLGIMIDGKFGVTQQYQSAVMPLGIHNHYKNQFVWLRLDVDGVLEATPDDFINHTWAINKKIGEPAWVLPLKDRFMQPYLREKKEKVESTLSWLRSNTAFIEKISNHYRNFTYPNIQNLDVDATLYEKGFLSFQDQEVCKKIHNAIPQNKIKFGNEFTEKHLKEILIRIMGRHFPDFLSQAEKDYFQEYMTSIRSNSEEKIKVDYKGVKRTTPKQALEEIKELYQQTLDSDQHDILKELESYLNMIQI